MTDPAIIEAAARAISGIAVAFILWWLSVEYFHDKRGLYRGALIVSGAVVYAIALWSWLI